MGRWQFGTVVLTLSCRLGSFCINGGFRGTAYAVQRGNYIILSLSLLITKFREPLNC